MASSALPCEYTSRLAPECKNDFLNVANAYHWVGRIEYISQGGCTVIKSENPMPVRLRKDLGQLLF